MRDEDPEIERMLLRYRPGNPAAGLRQRVLSGVAAQFPHPDPLPEYQARGWWIWAYRAALAAVLLLSFGLNRAAERMNATTAANIGSGPVVWDANAEQAAQLVGGGEAGRQYIAMCLAARTDRDTTTTIPSPW